MGHGWDGRKLPKRPPGRPANPASHRTPGNVRNSSIDRRRARFSPLPNGSGPDRTATFPFSACCRPEQRYGMTTSERIAGAVLCVWWLSSVEERRRRPAGRSDRTGQEHWRSRAGHVRWRWKAVGSRDAGGCCCPCVLPPIQIPISSAVASSAFSFQRRERRNATRTLATPPLYSCRLSPSLLLVIIQDDAPPGRNPPPASRLAVGRAVTTNKFLEKKSQPTLAWPNILD